MRFIDLERLREIPDWPPGRQQFSTRTPDAWKARLETARAELEKAATQEERGKIIDRYSDLWSEVKIHLRRRSFDKCWYCETSTKGFPGDIDHYRPKKGVEEAPDHEGYWWLAFEWRNWRFVCRFCNSENKDHETGEVGGKANQFPLLDNDESRRIKSREEYEEYEDLWRERSALLDPTVREDTDLITFTSEGVAVPAEKDERLVKHKRAKVSIKVYHLDRSSLNNSRKKIYIKAEKLVKAYRKYMSKWDSEQNHDDLERALEAGKELGLMIAHDAEYSAATITYLQEYFYSHPQETWVIKLLTSPSEPIYASINVQIVDAPPKKRKAGEPSS